MAHAKSLRVIGQALEVAKVATFELENDGQSSDVRSDSLTQTGEWILRNALTEKVLSLRSDRHSNINRSLRFSPTDISRLDTEAQRRRQPHSLSHMQGASKLSQLLRTLGDHLDRTEVSAFRISWTPLSVFVGYQGPGGQMIVERLPLKNCSSWVCIRDSGGPIVMSERFLSYIA